MYRPFVGRYLSKIPRSRIAGMCGKCMFNFVRNFQIVSYSSCTIWRVTVQCLELWFCLHFLLYGSVVVAFWIIVVYPIVVLICISLVTSGVFNLLVLSSPDLFFGEVHILIFYALSFLLVTEFSLCSRYKFFIRCCIFCKYFCQYAPLMQSLLSFTVVKVT